MSILSNQRNGIYMRSQAITIADYNALVRQSDILLTGKRGPRLLATCDNQLVKLFPARKLMSSNRLIPYAKRFVANAIKLQQRNIVTVQPTRYGKILGTPSYYVQYPKLAGKDMRALINEGSQINLLAEIAIFIATLHRLGIFFRGIHLANLLRLENKQIALLDITSVKFKSKPLSLDQRKRNILHLLNNLDDQPIFIKFGIHKFLECYFLAADLTEKRQNKLQKMVNFLC